MNELMRAKFEEWWAGYEAAWHTTRYRDDDAFAAYEAGYEVGVSACSALGWKTPIAAPEPVASLRRAVRKFVDAVNKNLDKGQFPQMYGVPFGALNELIAAASLAAPIEGATEPSVHSAESPSGQGWVAVSERLPEIGVPVFAWEGGYIVWRVREFIDSDGWNWCNAYSTHHTRSGWECEDEFDDEYAPTHWMPLPEPPSIEATSSWQLGRAISASPPDASGHRSKGIAMNSIEEREALARSLVGAWGLGQDRHLSSGELNAFVAGVYAALAASPPETPVLQSEPVAPTRIWIDTEFNEHEHRDELISMALVAEDGQEWYEVLPCAQPGPWVAENVIPKLGQEPTHPADFAESLHDFLARYESVHIIGDWPTDIALFCDRLITGPGQRIDTPALTMEIIRLDGESANPHNALADARGIRDAHLRYTLAQASDETAGVPVAWRWRREGEANWHFAARPDPLKAPGYVEEPLYASPPAASAETAPDHSADVSDESGRR